MSGKVRYLAGWWLVLLLSVASLAAGNDLRLAEAVKNQDRAAVRFLLQENADANSAFPDGATALAWAAHWDDLETADLLIRAGADVNAANDYGITPLSLACTNRNAAMAEMLLEAGADPNAAKWTGETPLMTAVSTGNLDVVKPLLAHGADVNAAETRRGQTALMWAVSFGHPEVVRVLIENGADVSARSHKLALDGFSPMVLEGYAAEVQATSGGGYTPLLFAARVGDMDSVRLLLAQGADVNEATAEDGSALVIASAGGYEELALLLLENGADPNAADGSGITALHYALRDGMRILHGMKEVRLQLAKSGRLRPADIQSATPKRESNILPGSNMPELMKALLAHGANPNAQILWPPPRMRLDFNPLLSLSGATPFFLAAATGDVGAMRTLVEGQAKPLMGTVVDQKQFSKKGFGDDNQIQGNGTPLMVAAGMGRRREFAEGSEEKALEAVRTLVELGADVNEATDTGWTALHAAAFIGADTIMQFLADHGAQVNVQNGCGQTPLSIAEGTNARGLLERVMPHKNSAELLRKLGAGTATPPPGPVGQCVEGRFGLEYATVKP